MYSTHKKRKREASKRSITLPRYKAEFIRNQSLFGEKIFFIFFLFFSSEWSKAQRCVCCLLRQEVFCCQVILRTSINDFFRKPFFFSPFFFVLPTRKLLVVVVFIFLCVRSVVLHCHLPFPSTDIILTLIPFPFPLLRSLFPLFSRISALFNYLTFTG